MLEGLEISEIRLSALERTFRMDSQFYSSVNLKASNLLGALRSKSITEVAIVSDGNHMGISESFVNDESGVPYYRGQDVGHFFIEQANTAAHIDHQTFSSPHMERSRLRKGDVLLSIVGTVGGLSLVTTDALAACSCKLAILRPKIISAELLSIFLQSHFGQIQIHCFKRGAVQMGLILEDFDQLKVPDFSAVFEIEIVQIVNLAFQSVSSAKAAYVAAEIGVLKAIGLYGFDVGTANINVKSFKNSFASTGRLDAEHYQLKYEALYQALAKNNRVFKLGDCLSFNQRGTQPDYADEGLPVVNSKHVQRGQVNMGDTRFASPPDKINAVVIQQGDVLMNGTGVGTIGRAAPYLHPEKALPDNHVTVLRTDAMSPICLALYLNSIAGQYQVDQHFKGSSGQIELYPADIANFWCPELDLTTQKKSEGALT